MNRKELIELNIQERLADYLRKNGTLGTEKSDEFLLLLKDKAPDLVKKFQDYLDWTAEQHGNEQEAFYLFGLKDGFWLMLNMIHHDISFYT